MEHSYRSGHKSLTAAAETVRMSTRALAATKSIANFQTVGPNWRAARRLRQANFSYQNNSKYGVGRKSSHNPALCLLIDLLWLIRMRTGMIIANFRCPKGARGFWGWSGGSRRPRGRARPAPREGKSLALASYTKSLKK